MKRDKIKSLPELKRILSRLKAKGKTIVFTNGCFDILHAGHVYLLDRAKKEGDILVVALNTDASVRALKGDSRPILRQKERAALLAAFGNVDYVTFFGELTPAKLIRMLRPDVIVKGGDWHEDEVVGKEFVESYGGRVVTVPYLKGKSTSGVINRILLTKGSRWSRRGRQKKR